MKNGERDNEESFPQLRHIQYKKVYCRSAVPHIPIIKGLSPKVQIFQVQMHEFCVQKRTERERERERKRERKRKRERERKRERRATPLLLPISPPQSARPDNEKWRFLFLLFHLPEKVKERERE
jgi:hypothetical protein